MRNSQHFYYKKIKTIFLCYKLILLPPCLWLCSCSQLQGSQDLSLDDLVIIVDSKDAAIKSEKEHLSWSQDDCLGSLQVLKDIDPSGYNEAIVNYHRVAEGYRFLNEHKGNMSADAKSVYEMSLNMREYLLCSKLEYNTFQQLKNKK